MPSSNSILIFDAIVLLPSSVLVTPRPGLAALVLGAFSLTLAYRLLRMGRG